MNDFKIGQAVLSRIEHLITTLKGAVNTWTEKNTFKKGVDIGTDAEEANAVGLTVGTSAKNQTLNVYGTTTLHGDLSVEGTTTTVNSSNLDIADNIIRLNKGANQLTTEASNSGFVFERKQGAEEAKLEFNETSDRFQVGIGAELAPLAVSDIKLGTIANNSSLGTLADFQAGFASTGPTGVEIEITNLTARVAVNENTISGLGTSSSKNVGTSASNVLQLDASAKIPAVDGSNITNLETNATIAGILERLTTLESA